MASSSACVVFVYSNPLVFEEGRGKRREELRKLETEKVRARAFLSVLAAGRCEARGGGKSEQRNAAEIITHARPHPLGSCSWRHGGRRPREEDGTRVLSKDRTE